MDKVNNCTFGIKDSTFKRNLQGSISVEMSYILPAIILILLVIIYTVFYFHDKNLLIGAAGETAVLGTQLQRQQEKDYVELQDFYRERIEKKLIFLNLTSIEVVDTGKWITVNVVAEKGYMRAHIVHKTGIIEPEKQLRIKKQLEVLVGKE